MNAPSESSKMEDTGVNRRVIQNIEAILALQTNATQKLSPPQRALERIVGIIATPRAIGAMASSIVVWCGANVALGHAAPDPPPFPILQCAVSVAALLVTMMVLAVQRTQGRRADQRDHLDLQVNLLAEQKIAKLIALVEELRRDLPSVQNRRDSLAEAMAEPVDPHAVVTVLDESLANRTTKP